MTAIVSLQWLHAETLQLHTSTVDHARADVIISALLISSVDHVVFNDVTSFFIIVMSLKA